MTEHVVLIFAYAFPPENTIGAARPFRFAKYLSRQGYNCRVFTASDQSGRNDPNTEYVPDPFVTHSRHHLSWQLERAIRKVFLPGELGIQWSYYASRAARAFIRAHPSTCVTLFSTFPPLGPHLAAWQLARSENLPWIADFRDPFPDGRGYKRANPFRKRVYRCLERVTARRADAVIANTDGAMVKWLEKFPSTNGKVHVIWNGFDPEERVAPLPTSSGPCQVLSHTGELYGGRSATPILESIARLIAANQLPTGGVRVRLIGNAEAGTLPNQEFLGRARAEGWLELITQEIPHREALQIARSSDSLLLLQPQSTTQVPGKLFEYLQIGRPILAFIQPNSSVERLLDRSGVPYRCVYPGSAPEVIDDIVAEFFNLPPAVVAASPWFEEQFNAENQTRMLGAIIRSLHNEPTRGINRFSEVPVGTKSTAANQNVRVNAQTSKAEIDHVDRM
jgi:glycosyltransferase involved in cell wall biosynthesis